MTALRTGKKLWGLRSEKGGIHASYRVKTQSAKRVLW